MKKIKIKQGICPKCGAELKYGMSTPDCGAMFYDVNCPSCDWSGQEYYSLVFDGLYENSGEKIKGGK